MADVLALDFGTKRIGVARASLEAMIPEPLDDVIVNGSEFEVIRVIVEDLEVNRMIIGLPRNSKGEETAESLRIRLMADKLKRHLFNLKVDIIFQDESLTSVTADQIMNDSELPYDADSRDSIAAAVILKEYLGAL